MYSAFLQALLFWKVGRVRQHTFYVEFAISEITTEQWPVYMINKKPQGRGQGDHNWSDRPKSSPGSSDGCLAADFLPPARYIGSPFLQRILLLRQTSSELHWLVPLYSSSTVLWNALEESFIKVISARHRLPSWHDYSYLPPCVNLIAQKQRGNIVYVTLHLNIAVLVRIVYCPLANCSEWQACLTQPGSQRFYFL